MSVTRWGGVTLTVKLGLTPTSSGYGLWGVGLWGLSKWGPSAVLTDVTAYVRSLSTDRQFSRAVQSWREGTATLVLNDRDGRFSAANLSGPYAAAGESQIRPKVPILITASYASTSYAIYAGYVKSWKESWSGGAVGKGDAMTTLSCVDEWAKLSKADLEGVAAIGAGESSGARVHRILNAAGNSAVRNIDTGLSTVQATVHGTGVVSELDQVVEAEGGGLWVEADGAVTFEGRQALTANTRSTTSQATFSDDGSDLRYAETEADYDDELLVNYASYTREGGTAQVASAPGSRSLYGYATDIRTGLICQTDAQALALAQFTVTQYQDPEDRFTAVKVKPLRDPTTLWPQVLGRRLRDMITVERNPPGGFTATRQCHIAGVSHEITPDNWVTTFALWSATVYATYATSRWDVGRWGAARWSF